MSYFNKDAIYTYLLLTDIGNEDDLMTDEEYFERLVVLRQCIAPDDKEELKNVSLRLKNVYEWYAFNEEQFHYKDVDQGTNERKKLQNESGDQFQGEDFDPMLHLITKSAGKISKWEFHKTDSDFFPSIPHGHAIINHKIKLDPYRGYIYKNNKKYDREKKQFIVELWNDHDFRDAARETILYYKQTFPTFRWRVEEPLRLPRRRRY